MIDADGLALMLWIGVAGLIAVFVAIGIESFLSRGMRHRRRRLAAYRRYTSMIDKSEP